MGLNTGKYREEAAKRRRSLESARQSKNPQIVSSDHWLGKGVLTHSQGWSSIEYWFVNKEEPIFLRISWHADGVHGIDGVRNLLTFVLASASQSDGKSATE